MRILILLSLVTFSSTASVKADDVTNLWIDLSAKVQNLHHQISAFGATSGLDFSTYEEDLKGIDKALEELVAAGELESKTVLLNVDGETGLNKIDELIPTIGQIGSKYGFFVASEMCDLGAKLRFMTFDQDQPIKLHLRLPREELELMTKRLKELGLTE